MARDPIAIRDQSLECFLIRSKLLDRVVDDFGALQDNAGSERFLAKQAARGFPLGSGRKHVLNDDFSLARVLRLRLGEQAHCLFLI